MELCQRAATRLVAREVAEARRVERVEEPPDEPGGQRAEVRKVWRQVAGQQEGEHALCDLVRAVGAGGDVATQLGRVRVERVRQRVLSLRVALRGEGDEVPEAESSLVDVLGEGLSELLLMQPRRDYVVDDKHCIALSEDFRLQHAHRSSRHLSLPLRHAQIAIVEAAERLIFGQAHADVHTPVAPTGAAHELVYHQVCAIGNEAARRARDANTSSGRSQR
mmetsp:Transcript_40358/g.129711  ORF Transcript_40358/g.129711 Transcript_40358/m.129711 type:complete len:221 (+) Transcript_40358:640-1302(+)